MFPKQKEASWGVCLTFAKQPDQHGRNPTELILEPRHQHAQPKKQDPEDAPRTTSKCGLLSHLDLHILHLPLSRHAAQQEAGARLDPGRPDLSPNLSSAA